MKHKEHNITNTKREDTKKINNQPKGETRKTQERQHERKQRNNNKCRKRKEEQRKNHY